MRIAIELIRLFGLLGGAAVLIVIFVRREALKLFLLLSIWMIAANLVRLVFIPRTWPPAWVQVIYWAIGVLLLAHLHYRWWPWKRRATTAAPSASSTVDHA